MSNTALIDASVTVMNNGSSAIADAGSTYSDPENMFLDIDILGEHNFDATSMNEMAQTDLTGSGFDIGDFMSEVPVSSGDNIDPFLLASSNPDAQLAFFPTQAFGRRRSQSQPPPLDHLEPLLSPRALPQAHTVAQPSLVRSISFRKKAQSSKRPRITRKARTVQPMQSTPRPCQEENRNHTATLVSKRSGGNDYTFHLYHDQTSLALGMQAKLHDFQQNIKSMQDYLRQAFLDGDCGPNHDARCQIESKRLESRQTNGQIRELGDFLAPLPLHNQDLQAATLPKTPAEIRELDHDSVNELLETFGLPYDARMFLGEKKLLYLRFIGVNRTMMHRVLD